MGHLTSLLVALALVAQLGSPNYRQRERAHSVIDNTLKQTDGFSGIELLSVLKSARASQDLETATRAEILCAQHERSFFMAHKYFVVASFTDKTYVYDEVDRLEKLKYLVYGSWFDRAHESSVVLASQLVGKKLEIYATNVLIVRPDDFGLSQLKTLKKLKGVIGVYPYSD